MKVNYVQKEEINLLNAVLEAVKNFCQGCSLGRLWEREDMYIYHFLCIQCFHLKNKRQYSGPMRISLMLPNYINDPGYTIVDAQLNVCLCQGARHMITPPKSIFKSGAFSIIVSR